MCRIGDAPRLHKERVWKLHPPLKVALFISPIELFMSYILFNKTAIITLALSVDSVRFSSKLSNLRRSWKSLNLCPVGEKCRWPWGLRVTFEVGQHCEGISIVGSTLIPSSWCLSLTNLEDTQLGSENWCQDTKAGVEAIYLGGSPRKKK